MSCKSSKASKNKKNEPSITIIKAPKYDSINTKDLASDIIDYAKQFEGVKYKFGGTTKAGMDCSGLVYRSYKAYNIHLPRVSRDMAKQGEKIYIDDVKVGDLLFFKTNDKRNTINHVGLVVTALPGNIEFIHSTTSLGVIISSLAEHYWYYAFVEARRIL